MMSSGGSWSITLGSGSRPASSCSIASHSSSLSLFPAHLFVAPAMARTASAWASHSAVLGCPQGPKKEKKKEMGHPRSQHFVLESRDIESVTRREGRWGFSKVYPWNGRIQP